MNPLTTVGIDIAKDKFDVAVLHQEKKYKDKSFKNTTKGFAELINWLRPFEDCHICMESTGSYGIGLATALHDAGFKISVENAARIHAFGQSELSRNKTDKSDARMIARYCRMYGPALWAPAPPAERKLRSFVTRLRHLQDMLQMEENRAGTAEPELLELIEKNLVSLQAQIKEVRQKIKDHINSDPDLKKNKELLESIPGIAEVLSSTLLAYLGDMSRFKNVKKIIAWAGLSPMLQESGLWKGQSRISKRGCAEVRRCLYMPAITAMRWNPHVKNLADRMKLENRKGKVIVCAAMKKLLQLAYGVLKSGRPFNMEKCLAH